jgi:hypothetical protein
VVASGPGCGPGPTASTVATSVLGSTPTLSSRGTAACRTGASSASPRTGSPTWAYRTATTRRPASAVGADRVRPASTNATELDASPGRSLHPGPPGAQHRRPVGPVEPHRAAGEDDDRSELQLDVRDDAQPRVAAEQRPEQVGTAVGGHPPAGAVCRDDVEGADAVAAGPYGPAGDRVRALTSHGRRACRRVSTAVPTCFRRCSAATAAGVVTDFGWSSDGRRPLRRRGGFDGRRGDGAAAWRSGCRTAGARVELRGVRRRRPDAVGADRAGRPPRRGRPLRPRRRSRPRRGAARAGPAGGRPPPAGQRRRAPQHRRRHRRGGRTRTAAGPLASTDSSASTTSGRGAVTAAGGGALAVVELRLLGAAAGRGAQATRRTPCAASAPPAQPSTRRRSTASRPSPLTSEAPGPAGEGRGTRTPVPASRGCAAVGPGRAAGAGRSARVSRR